MTEVQLAVAPRDDDSGCGGASCTCGEVDTEQIVFDVRRIPHAIRHATIFGALNSLVPGASIDVVADHDPVPLRSQLDQQNPGLFSTDYLNAGPGEWILRFTRC